jgi:hypothetical protein
MKAHELATITQQAIAKRNSERPAKLFDELLPKMKSQAEAGYTHLDFVFSDPKEIVDSVLEMLEENGYTIGKREKGIIRIGWSKPTKVASKTCGFDIAWVGTCKQEADQTGFCEEHRKEKCRCGRQAIRSCDATIGPFVCGFPTCGRCSHSH